MNDQNAKDLYVPAMAGYYASVQDLAYPMVRFFAGLILVPHGAQKLFGMFGGNIDGTAAFFVKAGLEPALPLAYLIGCVEFFGGILIRHRSVHSRRGGCGHNSAGGGCVLRPFDVSRQRVLLDQGRL